MTTSRSLFPRTASLLAAMLLFVSGCKSKGKDAPPKPGAAVRIESNLLVHHSLAETREAMASLYRLAPDHRLLDAAAYLDTRITSLPPSPVAAKFAGGAWHVTCRGQDVGELPELPSYEDGDRLL